MAETSNIAKMAENFAEKLARFTRWEKLGPRDMNWSCLQSWHDKATHPTDAVYAYQDPYDGRHTQILFDFKSLASASITASSMANALKNMALSLDCAMLSEEFKQNYPVPHDAEKNLLACLFVYNHDHTYSKSLGSHLAGAMRESWPKLKPDHEIILLEPETLIYLNSIRADFFAYLGEQDIRLEDSGFYYPDLQLPYHRKTCSQRYGAPLTLEQATAPFQVIRYNHQGSEHYILYARCQGTSSDEFILFFDYLMTYQILDRAASISIRLPYAQDETFPNFEKAKKEYADIVTPSSSVAKLVLQRLSLITVQNIAIQKETFIQSDLGMRS